MMSVTTNQPRGMNFHRPKPPIVPVTQKKVRDWWALFVNRKAYTRQSANLPHPETGRHHHYQTKNKDRTRCSAGQLRRSSLCRMEAKQECRTCTSRPSSR